VRFSIALGLSFVVLCAGCEPRDTPCFSPDGKTTKAYSQKDWSELGSLPFAAQSADNGWFIHVAHGVVTKPLIEGPNTGWVLESLPKDKRTKTEEELTGVEVFSPEGKKACTLSPAEIGKACHRGPREPVCARIFPDGKQLLVGFGTETSFRQHPHEYTFGVFDLKDGTLLWQGASDGLMGFPVVTEEAVYILEAGARNRYTGERTASALLAPAPEPGQPTPFPVLARHTAKGREVSAELSLGNKESAARYSASPDMKTLVVLVESGKPRLLLVPLKEKVSAQEVREISLELPPDKD
jgi:hypothetical protein